MTPKEDTSTVMIEREFAHSPEKLWRALTRSPLLAQWLMQNDFAPIPGHKFQFRADPVPNWNGIVDCEVLTVEPLRQLSYTWTSFGLETVVLFTLTPTVSGTHLRMEQSGFSPAHLHAFKGATYGWQKFLGALDQLLGQNAERESLA